ncbi:hypothetical protein OEZ86_013810 [Tetradesmus obliquus]|nr:hypothetical protein OEZ86_013810 [Tetradesmus obliquus]
MCRAQLKWGALAIEAECSACEAVAAELQRRLDAEVKRAHLDMRHRLDKDGNRYGKILDYKVSEQRAVNLLDDLCSTMDDYTMVAQEDSSSSTGSENAATAAAAEAANDSSSDSPAGSSSKKKKKGKKKSSKAGAATKAGAGELVWVKYKGEGGVNMPKAKRPHAGEEELRQKQLQTFCGMMLERYEEEVLEALTSDAFSSQGAAPVLCQRISSKCKGKQYPQLQLAAAAADVSSSASGQTEL